MPGPKRPRRKGISLDVLRQVHHEAGYRCANPACRTVLVIDVHHMAYVSEGGGNTAENLLALCKNCHGLHHQGVIPHESIRTWKMLLLSLNQAFDRHSVDVLLALDKLRELRVTPDALLAVAGLIASDFVTVTFAPPANPRYQGQTHVLALSPRGQVLVAGWKKGDQAAALALFGSRQSIRPPIDAMR